VQQRSLPSPSRSTSALHGENSSRLHSRLPCIPVFEFGHPGTRAGSVALPPSTAQRLASFNTSCRGEHSTRLLRTVLGQIAAPLLPLAPASATGEMPRIPACALENRHRRGGSRQWLLPAAAGLLLVERADAMKFAIWNREVVRSPQCAAVMYPFEGAQVEMTTAAGVIPDSPSWGVRTSANCDGTTLRFAFPAGPASGVGVTTLTRPGEDVSWVTSCCKIGCPNGPGCFTYCTVAGGMVTSLMARDDARLSVTLSGTIAVEYMAQCIRTIPVVDTRDSSNPFAGGLMETCEMTVEPATLPTTQVAPVTFGFHSILCPSGLCNNDAVWSLQTQLNLASPTPTPTRTPSPSPSVGAVVRADGFATGDAETGSDSSTVSAASTSSGEAPSWSVAKSVMSVICGVVVCLAVGMLGLYTLRRVWKSRW
jgi:hypothetical protein